MLLSFSVRNDRKRGTSHANAGDVPDVQATGSRGTGRVLEVRCQDRKYTVSVDVGQAVHS